MTAVSCHAKQSGNYLGLPDLGFGVGLREVHFDYLLRHEHGVDWFEVISENYIDNNGYSRYVLDQLREQTPLVMHGVSLSIGSTDPLNLQYLRELKQLASELQPVWLSDHLCWTGVQGRNSHDLLPLPLTDESFRHVSQRILQVQDLLERPLILENPSSYLQWAASDWHEADFLNQLANETGCGLLLDLNNVYVSCFNHQLDAGDYLQRLDLSHVVQLHLAGPVVHNGLLIDTHNQPVPDQVWQLYRSFCQRRTDCALLLEWDADIPPYPQMLLELDKARQVQQGLMPVAQPLAASSVAVSTPVAFHLGQML